MTGYVLLGSGVIAIGNLVRLIRWKRILGKDAIKKGLPEVSLGLSNLLNNYLPFRTGEVARVVIVSGQDGKRLLAVLASLVIERLLDVFALSAIFSIVSLNSARNSSAIDSNIWYPTWIYVSLTIVALVILRSIFKGHTFFKHLIRIMTLPFSQKLRHSIFYVALGISENIKGMLSKGKRLKILSQTVILWTIYFVGYEIITLGITNSTTDDHNKTFLKHFSPTGIIGNNSVDQMTKIAVIVLPNIVLLLLGAIVTAKHLSNLDQNNEAITNRFEFLPFMHKSAEFEFLDKYFSGKESDWCRAYRDVHQGIQIVRDVSGLSGARTALIRYQNNDLAFRKYAIGSGAHELLKQDVKLSELMAILPVAKVKKVYVGKNYCAYDMECEMQSEDIWSACGWLPLHKTIEILQNMISDLNKSLYMESVPVSTSATTTYLDKKLFSVLKSLSESPEIGALARSGYVNINGGVFATFENLLTRMENGGLEKLLTNDHSSKAHGDLTLKNIIYSPTRPKHYFLVDPSTSETYMSKFQDYAKILQSVLTSYESTAISTIELLDKDENGLTKIRYINRKSEVYAQLNSWFMATHIRHLKVEEQLVIQLHLVVHWARMCRHRIEVGDPAVVKYAVVLLVQCNNWLNDFDSSNPFSFSNENVQSSHATSSTSIPAL